MKNTKFPYTVRVSVSEAFLVYNVHKDSDAKMMSDLCKICVYDEVTTTNDDDKVRFTKWNDIETFIYPAKGKIIYGII